MQKWEREDRKRKVRGEKKSEGTRKIRKGRGGKLVGEEEGGRGEKTWP